MSLAVTAGDLYSWLRAVFPLAIAGTAVWAIWIYRFILSHRARPTVNDFRTSTSVVVPSYHEDPDILLSCLQTWRAQDPGEIIIVLDLADTEAYQRIRALEDPVIRPILFRHRGKRSALGRGIREASGEVLVLVDSDTRWEPGLLEAVQMPFADPGVGAVSTQQNVYQRTSSVWRRVADWLVNLRYYDYVPAMGAAGAVACVSGRTGAYRRDVVMPVLEHLENEFFLGRRCIAGDDGRLTWLVLASGYDTVHQSSARALSMFPDTLSAFVKQRLRWSRNSYRCYLTAVYKGWLWETPFITKVTVLQILVTPITMGITLGYLVVSRLAWDATSIGVALAWLLIGRAIRGWSHLRRHPEDIVYLPIVALVVILIALPVKLLAFVTMNKQGWLTRHADQIGGDGQSAASLDPVDPLDPADPVNVSGPKEPQQVEIGHPPASGHSPLAGVGHGPVAPPRRQHDGSPARTRDGLSARSYDEPGGRHREDVSVPVSAGDGPS